MTPQTQADKEVPAQLNSALVAKVAEKLSTPAPQKISLVDIWQMRYKRGAVTHDICFKLTRTDDFRADTKRATDLATRYTRFLGNKDNSKVILVGFPKPLALDLEEEMKKDAQIS